MPYVRLYRPPGESGGATAPVPSDDGGDDAGSVSRSEHGSFWRLADGRYFHPLEETAGPATSGGEGGMDTYGESSWSDYTARGEGGAWKAHGRPGDYGTEGTFDNTGGILPGYGQAPVTPAPGTTFLGGGDGSQHQGPIRGKFYNAAPEERFHRDPKEEGWVEAGMGGQGRPWWGLSPFAAATMGAGGVIAGMGGAMGAATSAIGGVEGAAGLGGSLTGAGGVVQPITGAISTGIKTLVKGILSGGNKTPTGLIAGRTGTTSTAPPAVESPNLSLVRPAQDATLYTRDGIPVFQNGIINSALV